MSTNFGRTTLFSNAYYIKRGNIHIDVVWVQIENDGGESRLTPFLGRRTPYTPKPLLPLFMECKLKSLKGGWSSKHTGRIVGGPLPEPKSLRPTSVTDTRPLLSCLSSNYWYRDSRPVSRKLSRPTSRPVPSGATVYGCPL